MTSLELYVFLTIISICTGQQTKQQVVTNCNELKICRSNVGAKPGCGCAGTNYQYDIEQFNECVINKNSRDRCPENRANYVCYNYTNQPCQAEVDVCYAKYHERVSPTEESAIYQCLGITVTNCNELKNCRSNVAAKPGCGCSGTNYQNDIDQFNGCLLQKNVRDRCPENRVNYVCYNYTNTPCKTEVDTCYAKYHELVSPAGETSLYQCLGIAVTNCDELKSCRSNVGAKPGCGCAGTNFQNDIDKYNACLREKNVRDRCPANRANYVCYNYTNPSCQPSIDTCYAK